MWLIYENNLCGIELLFPITSDDKQTNKKEAEGIQDNTFGRKTSNKSKEWHKALSCIIKIKCN